MEQEELMALCKRVSTWDQKHLDTLIGRPAIEFAKAHERDVRELARQMWSAFPLGPNWWRIKNALYEKKAKDRAIIARAEQIGKDRKSGKIVERYGRLVYADLGY